MSTNYTIKNKDLIKSSTAEETKNIDGSSQSTQDEYDKLFSPEIDLPKESSSIQEVDKDVLKEAIKINQESFFSNS